MNYSHQDELVDIIRLIRSENVGAKTFWNLISIYKTARTTLENIEELSLRGGKSKAIKVFSKSKAEDEIDTCIKKNVKILSYLDPDFPNLLKNIDDCPPILFCLGNIKLLNKQIIAMVGSRNASANGLRFAYKIAKNLTEKEKIIASGFAKGIDTAAHKASVDYATIAVLAGGVDHIYPLENKDLYYQIRDQGLVIAELPIGSIPQPQNFPQRNRIISGISSGVALIEASLKSGSLITARFALQQNKDLFVVPGFPLDPHYQGNNHLLKQGAYLLENAEDILEVINSTKISRSSLFEAKDQFLDAPKSPFVEKELTEARIEIINLVGASPCSIDEIASITQLPLGTILTIIVELELAGKLTRHFGNQVSMKL